MFKSVFILAGPSPESIDLILRVEAKLAVDPLTVDLEPTSGPLLVKPLPDSVYSPVHILNFSQMVERHHGIFAQGSTRAMKVGVSC